MTRTFSDGHPKVLPACNFLSQYYFYNIFLQKSCRFSLQTLKKFEAAKTGSGIGFLRLTAVWPTCRKRMEAWTLAQAKYFTAITMVLQSDILNSKFWFFWHKVWIKKKKNHKVNVHTCSLSSAKELSASWNRITWNIRSTSLSNKLYNLDLYWAHFLKAPGNLSLAGLLWVRIPSFSQIICLPLKLLVWRKPLLILRMCK